MDPSKSFSLVAKRSLENDYDSEFLELWADSELNSEESALFAVKKESIVEKAILKRANEREKSEIRSVIIPKRIRSEVHTITDAVSDSNEQFVRKKTNSARHSSLARVVAPSADEKKVPPSENTKQICQRLNLQVKVRNPQATQQSAEQVAKQVADNCDKCSKLEIQLKRAESKIEQLQQQLCQAQSQPKVDSKPCEKCNKRTKQRNIRQRNNQRKYREFFITNSGASVTAPQAE